MDTAVWRRLRRWWEEAGGGGGEWYLQVGCGRAGGWGSSGGTKSKKIVGRVGDVVVSGYEREGRDGAGSGIEKGGVWYAVKGVKWCVWRELGGYTRTSYFRNIYAFDVF